MIPRILSHVKHFQDNNPGSHVGGSIGLFLHGIDLKRDLSKSDIDMTIPDFLPPETFGLHFEESSSPSDFDYNVRFSLPGSSIYSKMDIRVSPEPQFVTRIFDGIEYRVSKANDIIFWKTVFAKKGSQKHIDDLIVINGGERPIREDVPVTVFNDTDLPF